MNDFLVSYRFFVDPDRCQRFHGHPISSHCKVEESIEVQ